MASISLSLAPPITPTPFKAGAAASDPPFIDEGFGTLDAETPGKAMSVLEELQEAKPAGIISHIRLAQSPEKLTSELS